MAIDIKEVRDTREKAVEGAVENLVIGADLVTGAAVTVAENVGRAIVHPVREARKIERRGATANKAISRDVAKMVEETTETLEAYLPERMALRGIHLVKDRARRKDLVGDLAYRTLQVVNGGIEAVLGTLNRFERATTPPTRSGSTHTRPARPARKATAAARRTASRAVRSTRGSARRGVHSARRTERKSV